MNSVIAKSFSRLILLLLALLLLLSFSACRQKAKDARSEDQNDFAAIARERADKEGLKVKEFDLNQDQRPDVFKWYEILKDEKTGATSLRLVKRELDLNQDGRMDVITIFNEDKAIESESFDLDFDGRLDMTNHYAGGIVVKKAIDFAFDEKPDMFKYYRRKQLTRVEKDRNNDGRIDYWEYYENGEIDRIGIDIDSDGQVDTWRNADDEKGGSQPRSTPSDDAADDKAKATPTPET